MNATLYSMRDNNLFRLAPSANPQALGLDGRSDSVTMTSLGLNFNKLLGNQRVIANLTALDSRYQRNDYLNFLAINYDAKLLWTVGRRWTGELSLDQNEALNTFSDYTNYRQRNIRTTDNQRFSANYWFHTSWAAVAGVYRTSVANEQPFLAESDYSGTGYNVGVRYRPVSGNTLTARAATLDGTYNKRKFNTVSQYDNGFQQNVYGLDLDWRLTGKSQVKGRLDYLERQHEHFSSRDYSGVVGNLDYVYSYSGKGLLTLGYKHDLASFQQVTASYYELDEINLLAQWAATAQVTAGARLGYGWRSYKGEIITLPAGFVQREDKYTRLGFDLGYQPARWLQLKAGITFENRNVNYDTLDYKDRIGFVSATLQY
ncbi:MAG: outer membrane beta-barrel protein [Azonexus sp.]|nr:outer membrane beta-barrel protein [Azonexus sp.]